MRRSNLRAITIPSEIMPEEDMNSLQSESKIRCFMYNYVYVIILDVLSSDITAANTRLVSSCFFDSTIFSVNSPGFKSLSIPLIPGAVIILRDLFLEIEIAF